MAYLHKRQIAASRKTCMDMQGGKDTRKLNSI